MKKKKKYIYEKILSPKNHVKSRKPLPISGLQYILTKKPVWTKAMNLSNNHYGDSTLDFLMSIGLGLLIFWNFFMSLWSY